jgi:uncharacterized phiE125 gp8 family phage protein
MMLVEETKIATADLPVATFKAHLRLGSGFSDDMLQDPVLEGCLRSALAAIESRTGKALMQRRFSVTANAWTPGAEQSLPIAPVTGLHALTTTDTAGSVTPHNISNFSLLRDAHTPKAVSLSGSWPAIAPQGSAKLTFIAGYGTAFQDLPADLAQAVLMLASHYYEARNIAGLSASAMPFGISVLIEPYKALRITAGGGR